MNADQSVLLAPLMERRYVREADDGSALVGHGVQASEKAHRSVSTASAENCAHAGVSEGVGQL
jgi:hypothetical protein